MERPARSRTPPDCTLGEPAPDAGGSARQWLNPDQGRGSPASTCLKKESPRARDAPVRSARLEIDPFEVTGGGLACGGVRGRTGAGEVVALDHEESASRERIDLNRRLGA